MSAQVADAAVLDSAVMGRLVEAVIGRLERGEQVDAELIAAEYQEAASVLVPMLPAIRGLVDLSGGCVAGTGAPTQWVGVPLSDDGSRSEPTTLGDYGIVRQIGRGGMGVVFEAEQVSLGRRVALKVLPFVELLDERTLARFQNEARAAASLEHPHIVPVHGSGQERGVYYYAMQLIRGCTVAEFVAGLREKVTEGETGREGEGERVRSEDVWQEAAAEPPSTQYSVPNTPHASADVPGAPNLNSAIFNRQSRSPSPPRSVSRSPLPLSPAHFRRVAEIGVQGRRGAGLCAQPRGRAPRYQAVEFAAGRERQGVGDRFWPGGNGGCSATHADR